MRTDRGKYFIDLALRCAHQGTCLRRNYGAVLVDNFNTIVSTGYTGQGVGLKHCVKCYRKENNIPSGSNYEMCRSVHAEVNAVIQAGKSARGCVLYLAGYDVDTGVQLKEPMPCYMCMKVIVNAGILAICNTDGESVFVVNNLCKILELMEKNIFNNGD